MIKSNAKSLLDNTAMLNKQTASSRHDVCLDHLSAKSLKIVPIFYVYMGKIPIFKFPSTLMEEFFIAILLSVCLSCLKSNV